jgi:hypothetical protein
MTPYLRRRDEVTSLSKAEAAKTIVWMALVSINIETIYNEVSNR